MLNATVVADTVNPLTATRITSFQLDFPRSLLAEFNKHRVLANSAASSRAVPLKRILELVQTDPFVPWHWGMNKPGMQAETEADEYLAADCRQSWVMARNAAVKYALELGAAGIHKQVVNRLLEPFMWTRMIVTATDWQNFFRQRDHPKAEPHFQDLARAMRVAMSASVPASEQVHLPLVTGPELSTYSLRTLARVSAARCGRVSYYDLPDTDQDVDRCLNRARKFLDSDVPDLVPFEHPCFASGVPGRHRHLRDWVPYRVAIETELGYHTVE